MDMDDVHNFGVEGFFVRLNLFSSLREYRYIKAKLATENPYSIGKDRQKKEKENITTQYGLFTRVYSEASGAQCSGICLPWYSC